MEERWYCLRRDSSFEIQIITNESVKFTHFQCLGTERLILSKIINPNTLSDIITCKIRYVQLLFKDIDENKKNMI